jgi:hypothetical protein
VAKSNEFDRFCRASFDLLDASGLPHLVIGGLAVIALGEPRTTADVDVLVYASDAEAEALVAQAIAAGFDARLEIERERLHATGTLRLRHGPFQLDAITASMPFEEDVRRRAIKKRMFGRQVLLPTPEDLVILKVLAGRDKDLLDAVGVARRHRSRLDRAYVERVIQDVCEAAEDVSHWERLQQVLRKANAP